MRKQKDFWKARVIVTIAGLIIIFLCFASFVPASFNQASPSSPLEDIEKFIDAWDRGDYLLALKGFENLLLSSQEEAVFERIALITGSLFKIKQVAPDGRNPRFSSDGKYLAIDSGPREAPQVLIFRAGQDFEKIAELKALRAVFSPAGPFLAYLQLPETGEIVSLRKELAQLSSSPSPDRAKIFSLQARLTLLEAQEATLVLRDLESRAERLLNTGSLFKSEIVFSPDGQQIYFVGGKSDEFDANQVYKVSIPPGSNEPKPEPVTSGPGFKINPLVVPGGRFLLYQNSSADPFARRALTPRGEGQTPETPRPTFSGQFSRQPARSFTVLDLKKGEAKTFEGGSIDLSPPGDSLAFVGREGNENILNLIRLDDSLNIIPLKKTTASLASPSYSPDGRQLAFEISIDGNNEIYLLDLENKNERRLTRELQPDRQPRFLSAKKLVAIKGEPRHSRSYLYDLSTGKALRIFHNESIRTIAPEYEWAYHPAGKAMVIVADYDGDTISPERGVYWVDLTAKVSPEELGQRIKKQHEAEASLRAKAQEFIKPLEKPIREVIAGISRRRLYEYQKNLFDFDSKHVTQPGNLKAVEYIQKTFESFGYQTELQWIPDRPNKTANVVAVLKGTENPDLYYVLSSHFDSNARGPGADDNSSATAVLLETARLLAKRPLPSSLILAAFTGEEAGFWGSREFVRLAQERKLRVLGAINNDMIGWTEDHRLDNTIRYANAGLRDLMHAASIGFSRMVTYDSHYIRATDAVPLYEAFGNVVAGLGSYPVLGNPYYHTALDRLEVVNQELIEEATKFMIASVMMMTSSPSPVRHVKATFNPDGTVKITWSPNPEKNIASYEVVCQVGEKGPLIKKKVKETQLTLKIDSAPQASFSQPELTSKGAAVKIIVRAVNRLGLPSWDHQIGS